MNTPNETTRTARPQFWLRAIEHRKHQLTREYRRTLSDSAREGISDEDYATTMATLEKMARNLGWDESSEQPHDRRSRERSRGSRFGFGPGHRGMRPFHPGSPQA